MDSYITRMAFLYIIGNAFCQVCHISKSQRNQDISHFITYLIRYADAKSSFMKSLILQHFATHGIPNLNSLRFKSRFRSIFLIQITYHRGIWIYLQFPHTNSPSGCCNSFRPPQNRPGSPRRLCEATGRVVERRLSAMRVQWRALPMPRLLGTPLAPANKAAAGFSAVPRRLNQAHSPPRTPAPSSG